MDLQDQLKNLFPDHKPEPAVSSPKKDIILWMQEAPLLCKYEKRKGKPITLIEGYKGADRDFKTLTKHLKSRFSTGGTYKKDVILIQGDFRDKIIQLLQELGFTTKRVGG
ncbi:MAG: translation initiation factor [Flavobacteriaceae bacterium]|nr:translation initiation factor [Flavobacteriaceae bacterium]MDH3796739.1 translation initiation factor [Flavobacteriaceae bacterium]